jgi:cytochrome P450
MSIPQVSLRRLKRDPIGVLAELADQQGDLATFGLGRQRILYVSSPSLIEEIFVRHAQQIGKWGRVRRWWIRRPPTFVDGELLKTHDQRQHLSARRTLQPAFRQSQVESQARELAALVASFTEQIATRDDIDLYRWSEALLVAATTHSLFGANLGLEDAESIADDVRLAQSVGRPTFTSGISGLHDKLSRLRMVSDAAEAATRLHALADDLLCRDSGAGPLPALLASAGARDPCAFVVSILLTALEPAAPALTKLWLSLGQSRLAEPVATEATAILGDRLPEANELEQLTHGRAIVMEALRLGAGWRVSRVCHEPFSVHGVDVRRGDWLIACPYLLHRDQRYFADPTKADLSHWTPGRAAHRPKYSFIPFGVSSRVCLGRDLTITLMTVAAATVARSWSIEVPADTATLPWHATAGGDIAPSAPMLAQLRRVSTTQTSTAAKTATGDGTQT